jgi:hypothetical protein
MNNEELNLSESFIETSWKLHEFCDALDLLKEARIKHGCNIEHCLELMRRGAGGDEEAVRALEYTISTSAQQVRLNLASKPKWRKLIEDIQLGRSRVKEMRVLMYQALRPFAMKDFEQK